VILAAAADSLASELFRREELRAVFRAFALAIPAYATGTVLLSALQAHHDVRYRMLVKYVSEPVFRFGLTLVFFILGWRLEGVLVGFVSALWLTVVLGYFALRRVHARLRDLGEAREPGQANMSRALLGYSAYLFAGTILMAAATRSDVLLLAYFADAHRVGIYAAALQTAAIMAALGRPRKGAIESSRPSPSPDGAGKGERSESSPSRLCRGGRPWL
jgi:O-antigen/teichoic acid export membrane protein